MANAKDVKNAREGETYLRSADLSGAELSGAELSGPNLDGAIMPGEDQIKRD